MPNAPLDTSRSTKVYIIFKLQTTKKVQKLANLTEKWFQKIIKGEYQAGIVLNSKSDSTWKTPYEIAYLIKVAKSLPEPCLQPTVCSCSAGAVIRLSFKSFMATD